MSFEIADKLIEYELSLSKLYEACAERFPKLSAFWKGLVRAEIRHADTIKELIDQLDRKTLVFNEKRFNICPLEISLEHVKSVTQRVIYEQIDLLAVISLALDIEQSIIESKYYEIFAGKSREFNDLLRKVRDESRGHKNLIRNMKQKIYENPKEHN